MRLLLGCSSKIYSTTLRRYAQCYKLPSHKAYQNCIFRCIHSTFRVANTENSDVYRSYNSLEEEAKYKEWKQSGNQPFYKRIGLYSKLSKARLTALVTLTTTAGYVIAPGAFVPYTLACTALGTFLCSASANSFNQCFEVPYDSQMARTKDRVLVRGMVRPLNSVYFGTISGLLGCTLLATMVNIPTACLGLANIILYAAVYTPSKRISIANTWIGAVVGAIPPIMGWMACTGSWDFNSLILAGMLFSWQFPHFNALSWNYRPDYSRAGYRMMSVTDPAKCRRVTLRHGIAQLPLSVAAAFFHVTNWSALVMNLPFNIYLALLSWEFYRNSNNNTARKLFLYTLIHLPVIMFFCIVCRYRNEYPNMNRGEDTVLSSPT